MLYAQPGVSNSMKTHAAFGHVTRLFDKKKEVAKQASNTLLWLLWWNNARHYSHVYCNVFFFFLLIHKQCTAGERDKEGETATQRQRLIETDTEIDRDRHRDRDRDWDRDREGKEDRERERQRDWRCYPLNSQRPIHVIPHRPWYMLQQPRYKHRSCCYHNLVASSSFTWQTISLV